MQVNVIQSRQYSLKNVVADYGNSCCSVYAIETLPLKYDLQNSSLLQFTYNS